MTRNLSFRVTNVREDLRLATSASIDSRVLRLAVYKFDRERSKEGVIVEFSANDADPLNIVEDFESAFLEAWRRARTPSLAGLAGHLVRQFWQLALAAIFLVFTYFVSEVFGPKGAYPLRDSNFTLLFTMTSSVAASFLFAALIESGPRIWALIRR